MANKRERLTTPVGVAIYPHLHAPDTKFRSEGEYSVKLAFDPAESEAAAEFKEYLDEQYEGAVPAAVEELIEKGTVKGKTAKAKRKAAERKVEASVHTPYTEEEDEDTGELTGRFIVNFKMKASGTRKDGTTWKMRPKLFDSIGTPLPRGLRVGSGSQLRISFEPNQYWTGALGAGFSCRLAAVQVIKLETWDGGSAEDFGFDEEYADGFSADDVDQDLFGNPEAKDFDEAEDDEDGDDDADF